MKLTYRTASEWYDRGYLIRTGERSHARNVRGIAMFNRDQVRRKDSRHVVHVHHYYY